jgi:hypothetical protein
MTVLLTLGVSVVNYGLGKHIWVASEGVVPVFFQGLFISELCYTGVMVFVKYSILALYWRLFKTTQVKIAIYVVAVVVTCWGVAVVSSNCLLPVMMLRWEETDRS